MAKFELLIIVTFATLVLCTEVEDVEQKKRGVGKGTNINTIPTGAQKQDYTYSIYSNPSTQSASNSYQPQVPNSFYPNQGSNQYYSSSNTQTETPSYTQQQQPQINILSPTANSQFVPFNFIPNPGYQAKYHIVPTKANGNIHLAIYQQPSNYPPPPIIPFSSQLYSPHASGQINSQQHFNIPPQAGNLNIASNYQALGGPYLGQSPTMFLFAQPSLNPAYNNLLYHNPLQNFYNYYPSNTQNKLNTQYTPQASNDYDKLQSSVAQSITKDDNDISHSSEYNSPSESSSSYKNTYTPSRNSYTKL